MDDTSRVLRGPFSIAGWAVAVAWLAVGTVAWLRLAEPLNWIVPVFCVLAGLGTAYVSWGLVVRVGAGGVSGVGVPAIAWEDIEHVGVRPGVVSVPFLTVRRGRALDELPLDGIAGFGRGSAVRMAQEVADAGGLGEVVVEGASRASAAGRRGIPQ